MLHCNLCVCFVIFEEIGVRGENAAIHLMMSFGMTILKAIMRRTMATIGHLGMTEVQRMVLLAFRKVLIIIMVYLQMDQHNSRWVVNVLIVLGDTFGRYISVISLQQSSCAFLGNGRPCLFRSSSPHSHDECRTVPSGCLPLNQVNWLEP